jgi:hypothetical protein
MDEISNPLLTLARILGRHAARAEIRAWKLANAQIATVSPAAAMSAKKPRPLHANLDPMFRRAPVASARRVPGPVGSRPKARRRALPSRAAPMQTQKIADRNDAGADMGSKPEQVALVACDQEIG